MGAAGRDYRQTGDASRMPHLFANRPRLHDLSSLPTDVRAQFRWETINAGLYKLGGLVFIVGSILFFPRFEAYADIGAWTFFFGSLLYLIVTGHDMAEAIRYSLAPQRTSPSVLELTASATYLSGTILFTVGSVFFLSQVGWTIAGAWCFVVGSALFVLGASVNVLQIVKASTLLSMQLMNLTAVSFVVGSVLFTVASIPYLWPVETHNDQRILYSFLAWQYLVGSGLFFLGGIFNYWKAYLMMRRAMGDPERGWKVPQSG